MLALLGLEACGIEYGAVSNCEPEVVGPIYVGDVHDELPFPDYSFDFVVSLNTLHNLKRDLIKPSQETERHKQVVVIVKTRSQRRALLTRQTDLGRQGLLRPPHFLAQG